MSQRLAIVSALLAVPAWAAVGVDPSVLSGQTFDYVIVGAGAAGLALANRLIEGGKSVAVIEAGNSGEDVMERILIPGLAYTDGVAVEGSPNDWNYHATALGRSFYQPRGKILGGSTAVNALYVVRASEIEHNAWAELHPNAPQDWSWSGLYPYFKETENFTQPSSEATNLVGYQVNMDYHGTQGPVKVSYPQYVYETARLWTPTMANLGLKTSDPQGGQGWGGYITPNSINPTDGTRSYSKTAYLDSIRDNDRLQVLLEHQAIKIEFDTSASPPRATGITFKQNANATSHTVNASGEVILAGGVFGTPQLLELSGVGARSVLEPLGIPVVAEVPGVGEHFQDHLLVSLAWTAAEGTRTGDLLTQSEEFKQSQIELFKQGKLNETMLSAANNGIGYVSLRQLMGNEGAETFIRQLKENMTDVLNSGTYTHDTVKAGHQLTYEKEVEKIIDSDVGVVELLLGSNGSWNRNNQTISMQAAIQHPMSRGHSHIRSTDPFDTPDINANYLDTDSDRIILREGLKFLRRVAQTEPLSSLIVDEIRPGPDVVDDAQIEEFVSRSASTQYHPASTASMLPLDKGGVVNTELKVYNTQNLRVIDSSVVPIGLCAHLMMPTYAIAEKGADILLNNTPQTNGSGLMTGVSPATTALAIFATIFTLLA